MANMQLYALSMPSSVSHSEYTSDDSSTDSEFYSDSFEAMEQEYYRNCRILKRFSNAKNNKTNSKNSSRQYIKPQSHLNFWLSRSNQHFWSYARYQNELLHHGYMRNTCINQHPLDIIKLCLNYTINPTQYALFNEKRVWWEDDDFCDDITEDTVIDQNVCVNFYQSKDNNANDLQTNKVQNTYKYVIEPISNDVWCSNQIIKINHQKYNAQYEFYVEFESIQNVFDGHVNIGIRSVNDSCNDSVAYYMHCFSFSDDKHIFICKSVFIQKIVDPTEDDTEQTICHRNATVSIPKLKDSETSKMVSLILQCSKLWTLHFVFNGEIIHSMRIQSNKSYIPSITIQKDDNKLDYSVKCKIISMKCRLRRPGMIECKKTKDKDVYIFCACEYHDQFITESEHFRTSHDVIKLLWKGYKLFCVNEHRCGLNKLPFNKWIETKIRTLLEIYQLFLDEYCYFIQKILSQKNGFGRNYIGRMECSNWYRIGGIITKYVTDDYSMQYEKYNYNKWNNKYYFRESFRSLLLDGFDLYKLWEGCQTCAAKENGKQIQEDVADFEISLEREATYNEELIMNKEYNQCLVEFAHDFTLRKNKFVSNEINKKWKNKHDNRTRLRYHISNAAVLETEDTEEKKQNAVQIIKYLIHVFKYDKHENEMNSSNIFLNDEFYGYLSFESDDSCLCEMWNNK